MNEDAPIPALGRRRWVSEPVEDHVRAIAASVDPTDTASAHDLVDALTEQNRTIHDVESVNLNPATNTMSPRAEAALAAGLGSRPSLGYPGEKYEMGLEAIEQIEIIAAELAARVFGAEFAEVRVPSGALANLYAFMASARPSDAIIAPPAEIAGHVTHHSAGAAGLYGLRVVPAPVDAERYTVDVDRLAVLARDTRPAVITTGASLNLTHHPVAALREIADEVGATLVFDAAHLSGPIAGGAWPNPLAEGAHAMTMSTYKSLAGPPSGLLVTNDPAIAERVDAIAFPGLTANFDVGKTAALAHTLADWIAHGEAHAHAMVGAADALARALERRSVTVHLADGAPTRSHAFAIDARAHGGGTALARHLRGAGLLTCAIGLPSGPDDGLRVGTNELVRWGATADDMDELADLVGGAIHAPDPTALAPDVRAFRGRFTHVHFAD